MGFPIALIGKLAGAAMSAIGGGISAGLTSQQQSFNNDLQQKSLALQYMQYLYQKDYDQWSQKFAETQRQDSLNAFNQQMQLAKSPISTLIQDGSSVGVNPMAAMGQNVGSASFSGGSIPSSNVNNGFGASSVPDSLGTSLMSMITSLAQTSMNNRTQEDISDKTLDNQRKMQIQELQFLREKQAQEYSLGKERNSISSRIADIQQQMANISKENLKRMSTKDIHDMAIDNKKQILAEIDSGFKRSLEYNKYTSDIKYKQLDYDENVRQFEKKYDFAMNKLEKDCKNADADRRQRYITSFIRTVAGLVGSIFGKGFAIGGFEE